MCVCRLYTFRKGHRLKKTKIVIPIKYQSKTIEKPSQVLHRVKPSGWGCTKFGLHSAAALGAPILVKPGHAGFHPTLYVVVGAMHCVFPLHKGVRICHKIACGIWIHISLDGSLPYRSLQSLLHKYVKCCPNFL